MAEASTTASAQIRTGVAAAIKESKNVRASKSGNSVPTGGNTPNTNTSHSNQSAATPASHTAETKNQPQQTTQQTSISDVRVDELVKKVQEGDASSLEVDELNKVAEETGNKELLVDNIKNNSSTSLKNNNNNKEVPKIERQDDDYDDPEDEDDKFDIQQGDFIDFLMKDVVLASAAYAGKKVSGFIGMSLYKASSWAYHHAKDDIVVPAYDDLKETWNKAVNNVKEALRDAGQYQFKYDFDATDETTKYGNIVLGSHNKEMKELMDLIGDPNSKPDFARFERLADKVLNKELTTDPNDTNNVYVNKSVALGTKDGTEERFWYDQETKTYVPIGSNLMQNFILRTAKYKTLLDTALNEGRITQEQHKEQLQKAKSGFAKTAQESFLLDAPERAFITNMTTASLLHLKAQGQNPSEEDKVLARLNARKVFLAEYIKIQRGTSNKFSSMKEFLDYSFEAAEQSKTNIDKGKYAEKDKTPENKYLDTLNNLNQQEVNSSDVRTLQEEAYLCNENSSRLNEILGPIERSLDATEYQKERNDEKRKRVQETRTRIQNNNSGATAEITPNNHQQSSRLPTNNNGGR